MIYKFITHSVKNSNIKVSYHKNSNYGENMTEKYLRSRKGQSAMEYLMTYGWAILIIAIVLVAFVGLNLFKSPIGTTCRAFTGYVCSGQIYSGNVLSVSIGQISGSTWTLTSVFMNGSGITGSISGSYSGSTLASGQMLPVTFTIPASDSSPGSIYVEYTLSGTTYNSLIATATFP